MKISRRLLYFVAFVGLAALAAVALSRIGNPSMASLLIWAVVAAALAGAPGLVHRRAWPAAFVLLPLGAYLVARLQMPLASTAHSIGGQIGFYLEQLRSGGHTYATHKFPLDLGSAPDVKLLLSLSMYAATGLAAFVALSLRKALPAIVITLIPLGFGLTVDSSTRVIWLPLAFVVLAGCMLMLSRSLLRESWKFADAVTGGATAVVATLLALSLLGATSVSASKPWGDWRAWGPLNDDTSRISFDWMANYPSLLNPQTDAPVMEVTSPVASYWRANSLDFFSGAAWISGWSYTSPLTAALLPGAYKYTVPSADPAASGKAVTETFDIRSLYTDFFFTGGTPTTLVTSQLVPVFANNALALRLPRPMGPELHYTLTAVVPQLKPADLVGKGRDYPDDVVQRYMALPFPTLAKLTSFDPRAEWQTTMSDSPADREWLGLYALNERIVGGATDPYEIALRIEEYLRSNFQYSLTPPKTDYESPYAAFLFATKTGYCQHFAGVMAALLRFNGIPARVDVGFTSGQRLSDGTYQVSRNNAHAWVEAYFPQAGWATFDPTPGRALPGAGPSSTTAGFVNPYTGAGSTASGALPTQKPASRPRNPASGRADQIPVGPGTPSGSVGWLLWILLPAGAVLVWPFGRAVVRRASLRRGSVERRFRASLDMVYAELRDYGVSVPPSRTLPETALFLEDYLGLEATPLAHRVEAVLFGGRAACAEDVADVTAFRRELRRKLRARKGLARTLLASYGLPIAAR
jgi:transglutaminase-like putative cysteine protease